MRIPVRTVSPGGAVPPGRLGYDLNAPVLLLHTIHSADAFEELQVTGRILPDPARAEPVFAEAYAWMLRRMGERLPTRGSGALWLWAKLPRAELVDSCKRPRNEVLLTCRIPRERVLLSDFIAWHQVLNRQPYVLPLPGESSGDFSPRIDAVLDDFWHRAQAAGIRDEPVSSWSPELRAEIEASWEPILDLASYKRGSVWQGTVHELRASDVIDAARITR
ncbi:DUF3841 domain-containing protein [Paenarthrobacter aromaticivorans]|uniref:DUF3841 domain-containing protein n=1 Tax=Paenarthrobacter aromaticivorans TaxID=2849150 RepID=A0ABS6IAG1_9MICC|nr:DUF3841 domain-containing protein [Paenarthrobacter sp. MMS21-TAE1-1]MBU8867833.1 DUF3841 domain-containing protein [Paenarthrobacter sp. MMS21-TAE1-1]